MTTPSDAENLAKKRASEKAKDVSDVNSSAAADKELTQPRFVKSKTPDSRPDLTSYEDLVKEYQTTFVRTSSGKVFEIETIGPGEYMMIFGSPLAQALTNMGLDPDDPKGSALRLADVSIEQKIDVLLGHDFQDFAENIICAGVISINFVRKPQRECDEDKQEVSISRLPFQDLCELFNAVIRLSVSGEEMGLIEFFREGSEEVSGERDSSSRDSESLQDTSIGVAVSEETGA